MIIYKNGLITLDYNPATDVLHVELPNAMTFGLSELQRSLEIVAEHVQSYDIKRLLLDSSYVVVGGIDDEAYRHVVMVFVENLAKTRLRKLARLNSSVQPHEERVVQVSGAAAVLYNASFEIRMFSSKAEAHTWLLQQQDAVPATAGTTLP